MAESPSTRLGLHAPSGGDPAAVPADVKRLRDQLDDVVLGYDQGVLSSRPAAGVEGRMYYATDDGVAYWDTGTGWVPLAWAPGDLRWTAATSAAPIGWLVCPANPVDPRALVSRTTFAALFAAIGTAWGRGDGSTTFGLPPADRVLLGASSARPVGSTGGSETHTLTVPQMPVHNHGGTTGSASLELPITNVVNNRAYSTFAQPSYRSADGNQPNTPHTHSIARDGGGEAHPNMQPWASAQLLIKT